MQMRKLRYRPEMLSSNNRKEFVHRYWSHLIRAARMLNRREIHPAEFAGYVLSLSLIIRCGHLYVNGKKSPDYIPCSDKTGVIYLPDGRNLMATLHSHSLRGVPNEAQNALLEWYHGKIHLSFFWKEPSVFEVLKLQSHNSRCLSLDPLASDFLVTNTHGRDFASFIIHDLMHAHFFFRPEFHDFQQRMSFYFVEHWNLPWLQSLRRIPHVWSQYEYLLSDMNTHPLHWLQTLTGLNFAARKVFSDEEFLESQNCIKKLSNFFEEHQLPALKSTSSEMGIFNPAQF